MPPCPRRSTRWSRRVAASVRKPDRHARAVKVFITGASSGIGEALARHYGSLHCTLGLFARRRELLDALAATVASECLPYGGDVRDAAALQDAGEDFVRRLGAPDIVIANAGISVGTSTQ